MKVEIVNIDQDRKEYINAIKKRRGKIKEFFNPTFFEYWKQKYEIGLKINGVLFWSAKYITESFNETEAIEIFEYVISNRESLCIGFVNECNEMLNKIKHDVVQKGDEHGK